MQGLEGRGEGGEKVEDYEDLLMSQANNIDRKVEEDVIRCATRE